MKKSLFLYLFYGLLFSCSEKENHRSSISTPSVSAGSNKEEKKSTESKENISSEGYTLINNSDCSGCHKTDAKLVGPSYKEIAEKYSEKDINYMATKIIEGGSGVWGVIPMQAHPNISKADAQKMAEYIVSFKIAQ